MSNHFTRILRHEGCHDADGEAPWTRVFVTLESAERTQDWNSVVSPTNPVWSIVRDQTGTIRYIRAWQGHSHGVAINRSLVFFPNRLLFGWKRHVPHGQFYQLQKTIQQNDLWAGGLSLRSMRQGCFFSALNHRLEGSRGHHSEAWCRASATSGGQELLDTTKGQSRMNSRSHG